MAKISFHQFLQEVRGNLGGFVVRKIRGQYFIGPKPGQEWKHQPTAGQKAFRRRFRLASQYAQAVQRNPELHAFYAPLAKERDLRVRALAISDWFDVPKVTAVDLARYRGRAGDSITIRATDRFGVVRVQVDILTADGHALERGNAVARSKTWRYTATTTLPRDQPVTIHVRAYDRPQNAGEWKATWPATAAVALI